MAFAKSIALRYAGGAESTDDLVQVANVGLMNAIKRYDPASGNPFVAFASPTINGELKRHFRDRVSTVRLPRGVYERIGRIEIAGNSLRGQLGREPTTEEIAAAVHCSPTEVEEAAQGIDSRHPTPLRRDDADREHGVLEEHLGALDQAFDLVEDRIATNAALKQLAPEERRIIALRFGHELSQSQIATRVGCSQMQVSRKLKQILNRLTELTGSPQGATQPNGHSTELQPLGR